VVFYPLSLFLRLQCFSSLLRILLRLLSECLAQMGNSTRLIQSKSFGGSHCHPWQLLLCTLVEGLRGSKICLSSLHYLFTSLSFLCFFPFIKQLVKTRHEKWISLFNLVLITSALIPCIYQLLSLLLHFHFDYFN